MLSNKKSGKAKYIAGLILCLLSCNKLVKIPEPGDTITTVEVFQSDEKANSTMAGIYNNMSWFQGNQNYANGQVTILAGLSSDEIKSFSNNTDFRQFQENAILPDNGPLVNFIWTPVYSDIYKTNAIIEGLKSSTAVSLQMKNQIEGEARFIRAFCYFYLVNLFGDCPLVTSTAWANSAIISRSPVDQVYQQIISDLESAVPLLPDGYPLSNGERIRADKWAATALLARVYLYRNEYQKAETAATAVINNTSAYSLVYDLDSAFLANNSEAIWQLQLADGYPWATQEGYQFVPYDSTSSPNFYLTDQLLAAFEPGDARRIFWVDSTHFSNSFYYYPYKYKSNAGESGSTTEYYTLLRLAEQYLIRAEASTRLNNDLAGAIDDLNIIRARAGLAALPSSLNQDEVLAAVMQENRIEFFSEWGHRWLDLNRTGQSDIILPAIKPKWKSTAKLYPIPLSEIKVDPNLEQNSGY